MLPTANNPIVTMTGSLSEDTLKTLMLRSLDGDEGAYRHLLHALRRLLTAYYGRRMDAASRGEVEDLVQETLLSLHAKRATYDRSRPFTAWFFSIARYKLIDHYRRGARMRGEVELDETLEADWSVDAVTARMDVERLLEDLPERQRELIRSVKLEGKSIAEAAKKTGQTELAARVGIHRTLKTLAAKLRGDT
ncbi:UNVERIFIED_ORG: RNA polymerase sigma-70 factor (ECF subfamily) [Rhizobium sp. SORGH_AS260]|uniref:RNA polymerase ECF-type sigma factor n=2 Tax=Rhizobium/Agrobacterium group TaxID=227290 RepID=U4Q674_9HYPH|nr:RNA polymerase sigma-70 factor (ECF subfamily) [Rhizobium sp. SORGH_AS_0285]MDP9754275.1 RNA polymerase sigma-70 factor (ECF subfamily) [Rhizobium sp. SORGH_AS_0260]MDR6083076.1 RNA polymerase sigma-70 factor (ECF subfamily) [Agrobacterium sp. SORGH_AS_0440]CDI09240.1 Putative RNA polymerase ECF-type sigma factor [Agrobacterium pusense]